MKLTGLAGLVVVTEIKGFVAIISRPNGSAVTNINDVHIIVESHNEVGATA
jgi:hypothetical protein